MSLLLAAAVLLMERSAPMAPTGRLVTATHEPVPVIVSLAAARGMLEAADPLAWAMPDPHPLVPQPIAPDHYALPKMRRRGEVRYVPDGTPVRLLGSAPGLRHVRGAVRGRRFDGWVERVYYRCDRRIRGER